MRVYSYKKAITNVLRWINAIRPLNSSVLRWL